MSSHITLSDRRKIKEYLEQGYSMRKIDGLLGYSPGTTRREIIRNTEPGAEYDPIKAHECIEKRMNRAYGSRKNKEFLDFVQARLDQGMSPVQIIRCEKLNISPLTIYRYIHSGLLKVKGELKKVPWKKS